MCSFTIFEFQCAHHHRFHDTVDLYYSSSGQPTCRECCICRQRPPRAARHGLGNPERHGSECAYFHRKGLPCATDNVWWFIRKPADECHLCIEMELLGDSSAAEDDEEQVELLLADVAAEVDNEYNPETELMNQNHDFASQSAVVEAYIAASIEFDEQIIMPQDLTAGQVPISSMKKARRGVEADDELAVQAILPTLLRDGHVGQNQHNQYEAPTINLDIDTLTFLGDCSSRNRWFCKHLSYDACPFATLVPKHAEVYSLACIDFRYEDWWNRAAQREYVFLHTRPMQHPKKTTWHCYRQIENMDLRMGWMMR